MQKSEARVEIVTFQNQVHESCLQPVLYHLYRRIRIQEKIDSLGMHYINVLELNLALDELQVKL